MTNYKRKTKIIDKTNLSIPEYIALYRANPAAWAKEQTRVFYDDNTKIISEPHYYQQLVMNGMYSNKLSVVLKCRQCLVGSTLIDVYDKKYNKMKIEDIFTLFKNNKCPAIKSLDKKNNVKRDKIVDVWCVGEKEVYEININNHYVICTDEHKFNTLNGYKTLKELTFFDKVYIPELKKYEYIDFITSCGKEVCYDLTTEKNHNYIANGISVHNSGFSTALTAMFAHDVLFGLTKGILFVSVSKVHAEELMDKFYKALDSIIDPRFRVTYVRKTKTDCEFVNGIKARSLSSNSDSMIGFTGSVLWDEAGKFDIQKSEDVWTALFPSITTAGTRMYVVSTPFGKNNIFHKLCTNTINMDEFGKDIHQSDIGRRIVKVHYTDVPHVRKQARLLRANCVTEAAWRMGYCLEFGNDKVDSLFPYEFMRDYAYSNEADIVPFDLNTLLLKNDLTNEYIIKENPLYA